MGQDAPPVVKVEAVGVQNRTVEEIMSLVAKHPLFVSLSVNPTSNEISVTGSEDTIAQARKLINSLDTPLRQIEVKGAVLDTTDVDSGNYSIDWEFFGREDKDANGVAKIQLKDLVLGYTNPFTGSLLFSMNKSKDKLKIMDESQLTVTEWKKNPLFIGTVIFYPTYYLGVNTTVPLLKPEGIKTGVEMMVVAHAIDETDPVTGKTIQKVAVSMDIEVSEITGSGPQGLPIINSRKTSTNLTVNSGETIICAGLDATVDYSLKGYSGPKFLQHIPLLNRLFRTKRIEGRKKKVVMLLTPTVLPRPLEKKVPEATKVIEERSKELEASKAVVKERKPVLGIPEKPAKDDKVEEEKTPEQGTIPTNENTDKATTE